MATSSSGGRSRSTRREPPTNPEVNVDLVILIDISDAFSLEIQVKPLYIKKKKDALLYKNTNHVVRLCYVIISDFFYQNIEYLPRKNCSRNPYCVK